MGRESAAQIRFGGQTGAGKILLETEELILRGAVRARIPRSNITAYLADGDDLVIETAQGPIRASLGARETALWLKALARPAPGLADKLGIGPDRPVRILGTLSDPDLIAAIAGAVSTDPAAPLIAELESPADLDALCAAIATSSARAVWGVTRKGKASPLPESILRDRLRADGFIDTKSCAVSALRSATRFQRR